MTITPIVAKTKASRANFVRKRAALKRATADKFEKTVAEPVAKAEEALNGAKIGFFKRMAEGVKSFVEKVKAFFVNIFKKSENK